MTALEFWAVQKVNLRLFVWQLKIKRRRWAIKVEGGCSLQSGGFGGVGGLREGAVGVMAMNMG